MWMDRGIFLLPKVAPLNFEICALLYKQEGNFFGDRPFNEEKPCISFAAFSRKNGMLQPDLGLISSGIIDNWDTGLGYPNTSEQHGELVFNHSDSENLIAMITRVFVVSDKNSVQGK
jgi:hypothetical protein